MTTNNMNDDRKEKPMTAEENEAGKTPLDVILEIHVKGLFCILGTVAIMCVQNETTSL